MIQPNSATPRAELEVANHANIDSSVLNTNPYPGYAIQSRNKRVLIAVTVLSKVWSSHHVTRMLCEKICLAMIKIPTIQFLFYELFHNNKFSKDIILGAMRYYMEVVGNVHAKEL